MDRASVPGIEELLASADRRALRVLSAPARCIILALRSLRSSTLDPESLTAIAAGLGFRCDAKSVLGYLERVGLVSCSGRSCMLTVYGREVADALNDVVEGLRSFAYRVVDGVYSGDDVAVELVTASASIVGVVEAYVEEPRLFPLYLVMHSYISTLTAVVLALLARVDARLLDSIENFLEED